MTPLRSIFALSAASLALAASGLQAQTRDQIQGNLPDREQPDDSVALTLDTTLLSAPCPLSDPQFADMQFTLAQVQFDAPPAFDTRLLDSSWRSMAGQTIGLARVCEIRDRASEELRDMGYLASIRVPPQTIDQGVVRLEVVLARLTGLVIRGEPGPNGEMVRRYFEDLRAAPFFRRDLAERKLLLARDIPGMDVRLSLTRDVGPDAQPGDLVGIVDVAARRFEADLAVQNFSSDPVGPVGGALRVQLNGLTGMADLTEVSFYSTLDPSEQTVLQGRHEFGLGSDGFRMGLGVVKAWTQPDVAGPDVFDADTLVATLYASYPLVRRQTTSTVLTGGFELIDQSLDFTGVPISEDNMRMLFARLETSFLDRASADGAGGYSPAEPRFSGGAALEVRQGFDVLGASKPCGTGFARCLLPTEIPLGRLDADPTPFVVRAEGRIDYRPEPDWLFSLKPRAQFSLDPLLAYEQFSGGNFTTGRGYDPGSAVGDSGIGAQLELAYGSLLPSTPDGTAFQPFVFFDSFAAWSENVPGDPVTLNSIGGGVRVNFRRRAFFELIGAVPLERGPLQATRGDARLLFNLAVRLGK